jgi:hypothetical protein
VGNWKVVTMGAVAAAISAIIFLGAQINEYIPALVTAEELEEVRIELAGSVSANTANVLGIQRRDARRSLTELRQDIKTVESKGQQPSAEQWELLGIYEDDLLRINEALKELK